jgi:hypothetical protein
MTAVWAGTCVTGLAWMGRYAATPGAGAPAADWPAGSRVARAATGDTLVVVFHPMCPCSRATIQNLAVLMAHCPPGTVHATALFVRPAGMPDGWERTDLWTSAGAIPGVTVMTDDGGVEATRFHAQTSGQTLLFDAAGRLRFRGGITPGRGHAGDSGGADSVAEIVRGEAGSVDQTPVFGCPLNGAATTAGARTTACQR